jgi:outer membrane protein assembly factor BamB
VVSENIVYVNSGFMKAQLYAIELGGKGNITKSHVLWKQRKQMGHRASPLIVGDYIYALKDESILSCLNKKTGDIKWSQRIKGKFSASPIYANGHIYVSNHEGVTIVIKPSTAFEQVSENKLDSGIMASLAISNNALFIRTTSHIYCIETN